MYVCKYLYVQVREFASNWRTGIQQINDNVLAYFANFRNGMEILKQVRLLLDWWDFQNVFSFALAYNMVILVKASLLLRGVVMVVVIAEVVVAVVVTVVVVVVVVAVVVAVVVGFGGGGLVVVVMAVVVV